MKNILIRGCLIVVACLIPVWGFSAEVPPDTARQVAEHFLQRHLATYGTWGNAAVPIMGTAEVAVYQGMPLAYNFPVQPRGHILVAYYDEFSPVLLYSTTSSFLPARAAQPSSIESWVLPELYATYQQFHERREALAPNVNYAETRVAQAWNVLKGETGQVNAATREETRLLSVGPLLTTRWDQGAPYNQYTPGVSGQCTHTLTGCIATAWAQLMKYWNWPPRGIGSQSYYWNDRVLSANFEHDYNWANMPDYLYNTSSTAQKDAVARLISDVGIAATMNYGCYGSGSSIFADDVLDVFFRYKSSMIHRNRGAFTASAWFNFFKTELDAVPPRPVVLSIFSTSGGGHEVIADGYQSELTDRVHINLGWSGSYDGYYDVTNNFTTGSLTWASNNQVIVTNIEPDLYGGLDCSKAILLTPGIAYAGSTTYAPANAMVYNCSTWRDTGPERVHKIYVPVSGTIHARLTSAIRNLDLFLLNSCNQTSCLAAGSTNNPILFQNAPAGVYYLVVDGYQGAKGAYTLTVDAPSGYDNWISWLPGAAQTIGTVSMMVFNPGGGDRLYQAIRAYGANQVQTRFLSDSYNWTPWMTNPIKTAGTISLSVFKGRLYQALRGYDNQMWTRSTADGDAWTEWGGNDLTLKTASNVAMTVFKDRLYQAVRGYGNNLVWTRSTPDGITWTIRGGESRTTAISDVTMIAFDNQLFQAIRGYGNNAVWTRSTSDGMTWSDWSGKTTPRVGGNVMMAVFNPSDGDRLYQAIGEYGTGKVLTRYTKDGTIWTDWIPGTPKTTQSDVMMKAVTIGGRSRLYQAIKTGGKVATRYTTDGENWTTWVTDGPTYTPVSMEVFNPAGSGDRLYQAVSGSSSKVWTRFTTGIPVMMPPPLTVTMKKTGDGAGVISVSDQVCGVECVEMTIPYLEGAMTQLTVTPTADSYFVRWEKADGTPLAGLTYVKPGDTVMAVFHKK